MWNNRKYQAAFWITLAMLVLTLALEAVEALL